MSITFKKSIEEINDFDPVLKQWYYHNWLADKSDKMEEIKELGLLVGSFIDVERVRNILGEGGNKHISSEEEFDESTAMIKNFDLKIPRPRGIDG